MQSQIISQDIKEIVSEFKQPLITLSGKKIFVTGGNGFLGSYLVDTFVEVNKELKEPSRIVVLNKNKISERSRLSHLIKDPNLEFMVKDVGEPFQMSFNPDIIIHAASIASPKSFLTNPFETIDSTVNGVRTLLEHARSHPAENFLFISSADVYGNPPPEFTPTPETYTGNVNCIDPRACYSESKRFAETLCSSFFRTYDVPTKILRLGHTYGPGLRDDKAIHEFFLKSRRDKEINLRDNGQASMSFCYVSDAIRGIFKVMFEGESGEPYNIGNGFPRTSIKDLATSIGEVQHNNTIVNPNYFKPNDDSKEYIRDLDITKLEELGYEPRVSLKQGLEKLKKHIDEVSL